MILQAVAIVILAISNVILATRLNNLARRVGRLEYDR